MLKKMGNRLKNQKGLTLIELLAVIVILGIIAAIAIPSIGNIIAKSEFEASKADTIQLLNAGNLFLASEGARADGTYSHDGAGNLAPFVDISDKNLSSWSVKIDNGVVTVTAASTETGFSVKDANLEAIQAENFEDGDS